MKYSKYIIICLLFFIYLPIFGQFGFKAESIKEYDILDVSDWRIAYSLEYVWDIEQLSSKCSDILYLDIGKKISKCYSHKAFMVDSIVAIKKKDTYVPSRESLPEEVYKNGLDVQTKVVYRSPDSNSPVFLYTDDYCNFNWEVHSDRKMILDYSCQKATTTFRGRTWEAWFAAEIPISDGPWKFCGLSGLILEVSDSQKHYAFTCTGIEKKQIPIMMYKWNYEKTTRKGLNSFLTQFYSNPKAYFESTGIMVIIENKSNKSDFSFPYNPIELE